MTRDAEQPDEGERSPRLTPLALSLVIPAYNEASRLADGVSRLRAAVKAGRIDPETTEFVVVDDGSTDTTSSCAETLFCRFPHWQTVRLAENRGKGAAVRAGVSAATAPIIAFADADMSIDPSQTPEFLRALARADVAIGSRAAVGASVDRPSMRRSAMNRSFNALVNVLTRVSLSDTQCGFKAFRAPAAKLLFHCSVTQRFAFDVEILALARRLGLTIDQVPVQWTRVRGSRVRPWFDARSMTRDVVRASRRVTTAPAVTALTLDPHRPRIRGGDTATSSLALQRELSPVTPVLRLENGHVLVLCPLMDAAEIEKTAERMAVDFADGAVGRSLLNITQLCALAPLPLRWDT
jgi:hypothetical protein